LARLVDFKFLLWGDALSGLSLLTSAQLRAGFQPVYFSSHPIFVNFNPYDAAHVLIIDKYLTGINRSRKTHKIERI
jgi:hypothetical protein